MKINSINNLKDLHDLASLGAPTIEDSGKTKIVNVDSLIVNRYIRRCRGHINLGLKDLVGSGYDDYVSDIVMDSPLSNHEATIVKLYELTNCEQANRSHRIYWKFNNTGKILTAVRYILDLKLPFKEELEVLLILDKLIWYDYINKELLPWFISGRSNKGWLISYDFKVEDFANLISFENRLKYPIFVEHLGNFNLLKGDIELIEQGLADKLEQLLNVFLKTENYAEMIEVYYQIHLLVKPHHAGTTLNEHKLTDSDERSRLDFYLAEIDESVDNDAVTNLVNSTLIRKRSIKPRHFYDVLDWKQIIFPELMNLIYDMK